MEEDRTCKRCSVSRVNALVEAYNQAHGRGDARALKGLGRAAAEVRAKGYAPARDLLKAGLTREDIRALCWNVSSLLKDDDMLRLFGRRLSR